MMNAAPHVRQVEAIANGTVIDHIPSRSTLQIAAAIANQNDEVLIGMNFRSKRGGTKGVIKINGHELDARRLDRLALLAPEATINIIRDYAVVEKRPVVVPERFVGVAQCNNANCITNHEQWPTHFRTRSRDPLVVQCVHCERLFHGHELSML